MRTEGKAKILTPDGETLLVTFKDAATAFNGVKKAEIPGKGNLNARFTALLFSVLEAVGILTCFVDKGFNENQLRYRPLTMIPLEVVVRNNALGSLCKRYALKQGASLPRPIVEFYVKNDALNDPQITEELIELLNYLPVGVTVEALKQSALAANEAFLSYFDRFGIRCADFKLEFGLDAQGILTVGDELSPDNFRLRDKQTGQILDKDVFRLELGDLVTTYQALWDRLQGQPMPVATEAPRSYAGCVVVKSRQNILNPESKAILETLHSLGYQDVSAINAEKQYELLLTAPNLALATQRVACLADLVLSNPVIEDVDILVKAV